MKFDTFEVSRVSVSLTDIANHGDAHRIFIPTGAVARIEATIGTSKLTIDEPLSREELEKLVEIRQSIRRRFG